MKIRILIVDDHALVRLGMAQLIGEEADMEVCGEAETAVDALKLIETQKPDLVVIDLSLRDGSGLDLIGQVRSAHPQVRMLVASMHDETLFAERVLRAGAMGYLGKQEPPEAVVRAIRQIMDDKVYLSTPVAERLLTSLTRNEAPSEQSPVGRLSNRELQIYELIGQGISTREIAHRLHLSIKTIETHRESIKRKLALKSNLELIRHAVQWSLEHGGG